MGYIVDLKPLYIHTAPSWVIVLVSTQQSPRSSATGTRSLWSIHEVIDRRDGECLPYLVPISSRVITHGQQR
jgi:hypothetical protein